MLFTFFTLHYFLPLDPKQLQPLALVDVMTKEQQAKIQTKSEYYQTQLLVKMSTLLRRLKGL